MTPKQEKGLHALVDGDVLKFRACMATQYYMRSAYLAGEKDLPALVSLRYDKDMKEWIANEGYEPEEIEIVTTKVVESPRVAFRTARKMMHHLRERFRDVTLVFSGKGNFRNDVATEQPYKGNRWSEEKRAEMRKAGKWIEWLDATEEKHTVPERPVHEAAMLEYLMKFYPYVESVHEEADDLLGIMQFQEKDTVIVSVDKDLRMIPGYHLDMADMREKEVEYVDPTEGLRNFYTQLVMGDRTDNIPKLPGLGNAKAPRVVKGLKTREDMFMAVFKAYQNYYGDSQETALKIWKMLVERGTLLWIRRLEGQMWNPPITLNTLLSTLYPES